MVKIKAKYIPTQEMIFLASKLAETLSLKFWGQENRKDKIGKKKKKEDRQNTKVKWKK